MKNPLKLDPTRTTLLRKAFMRDMHRRFNTLRKAINNLIITEDVFGIQADKDTTAKAIVIKRQTLFKKIAFNQVFMSHILSGMITNVVRKTGGRWYVYSNKGEKLSKGYHKKASAQVRLKQIEYYKHLASKNITMNTRWRFETDDVKLGAYRQWLQQQIDSGILEVVDSKDTPWTAKYIQSAYKKGLTRAYIDANKAGWAAEDFTFFEGGKEGFLNMAFGGPTAQSKLRTLYTRDYAQLKGMTTDIDKEMSRILADAIARGDGARTIARQLNKSLTTIEKKRAMLIARTEIVHAHAEGQLDSFEMLGVEEVGVEAEWSTAGDDRVCPLCSALEGVVLPVKKARGLLPRHPNCVTGNMCVFAPNSLALVKAYYTGEIIDFATVGGRHISITPAHVLLTKYGFARSELIHEGIDLVIDDGLYGRIKTPDYNRDIPSISNEFKSASESFRMFTVSMPLSPEDLHGEGRSCNEKVDIVFTNSVLGDHRYIDGGETFFDGTLPFCSGGLSDSALCSITKLFSSMAHTADCSMGRFRDALAFLLGCVFKANNIGLRTIASRNSSIFKPFDNNVSIDIEFFRDCLNRHPVFKQINDKFSIDWISILSGSTPNLTPFFNKTGLDSISLYSEMFSNFINIPSIDNMKFDKICVIQKRHVVNLPVYDAQTISTIYSINGIISSNCRCAWIPAMVGEKKYGTTKTKWSGKGQGLSAPGTKPTGRTRVQITQKSKINKRIEKSIKAEHPKLKTKEAKEKSKWIGADLNV